LRKEPGLKGKR